MTVTAHRGGVYKLYETVEGNDELILDDKDAYRLPDGASGGRMFRAAAVTESHRSISQGVYHLVTLAGEPDLHDGAYLLLEGGSHIYTIWRLEPALPDRATAASFQPDLDNVLNQEQVDTLLDRRSRR